MYGCLAFQTCTVKVHKMDRVNCLFTWIHLMTKVLHTDARSQSLTHTVVLGALCVTWGDQCQAAETHRPLLYSFNAENTRVHAASEHKHVKCASVHKFVWKHVACHFMYDSSYCNAELTWTLFYPIHSNWIVAASATRLFPFPTVPGLFICFVFKDKSL